MSKNKQYTVILVHESGCSEPLPWALRVKASDLDEAIRLAPAAFAKRIDVPLDEIGGESLTCVAVLEGACKDVCMESTVEYEENEAGEWAVEE
jgi:hypothetical protein